MCNTAPLLRENVYQGKSLTDTKQVYTKCEYFPHIKQTKQIYKLDQQNKHSNINPLGYLESGKTDIS